MTKFLPFKRAFFQPSADIVAPKLLGHFLVRNSPEGLSGGVIVEVEAYLTGDPACHAFNGETARNRVMWGPPGHAYVYFIYGNHWCFNVVCQPSGIGEAILVRAIEPVFGVQLMRARRVVSQERQLTNGPGKLCAALDISRELDGADLCDSHSPVFIAKNPSRRALLRRHGPLLTTTRIGIVKAADKPLRFLLAGSGYVSRKPSVV